jgi:hypothetical protein
LFGIFSVRAEEGYFFAILAANQLLFIDTNDLKSGILQRGGRRIDRREFKR